MATIITQECINCGACEPECPNTAIYQGGVEFEHEGTKSPAIQADIFYIVPEKCTECVGFYDYEACAAVCPVDCCVPDPSRPESEEALFLRAKALHPGKDFPAEFPSRFHPGRTGGADTASSKKAAEVAEPAAQSKAAASAPSAGPTVKGAAAAKPGADKKATAAGSPQATASPSASSAAPSGGGRGPAASTVARVERAVSRPARALAAGNPAQPQAGELPSAFAEILARARAPRVTPTSRMLGTALVIASPLLGALPHSTKKVLENAVGPGSW